MCSWGIRLLFVGMIVGWLLAGAVAGHSGRTDSSGGHYNRKTGGYHYHNSGSSSRSSLSSSAGTYSNSSSTRSILDVTPRTSYRTEPKTTARTAYRAAPPAPPQVERFTHVVLESARTGSIALYRILLVPKAGTTPEDDDLRKIAKQLEEADFVAIFSVGQNSKPASPCATVTRSPGKDLEIRFLDERFRVWRDITGKFSIEAEFAGYSMGTVRLRKIEGTEIILPMDRLSEEDQEWILTRRH